MHVYGRHYKVLLLVCKKMYLHLESGSAGSQVQGSSQDQRDRQGCGKLILERLALTLLDVFIGGFFSMFFGWRIFLSMKKFEPSDSV